MNNNENGPELHSLLKPLRSINPGGTRKVLTAQELIDMAPSETYGKPTSNTAPENSQVAIPEIIPEVISETPVLRSASNSIMFTPMEKVGLRLYDKFVDRFNQGIFDDEVLTRQRIAESSGKQFFDESMLSNPAFKGKGFKSGDIVTSSAGALGIAQFMPSTWNGLKAQGIIPKDFDIRNEDHQKKAQAIYMTYLHDFNYDKSVDVLGLNRKRLAVAAYNAGPGTIQKAIRKYGKDWDKYLREETTNYLPKIIDIDMSK